MKKYPSKHHPGRRVVARLACAKQNRTKKIQYKTYRLSDYSRRVIPSLVLSGVWFENAGFQIGDSVNIQILDGGILITNLIPF